MGSNWSNAMFSFGSANRRSNKLMKAQRLYQHGDIDKAMAIWTKLSSERHVSDCDKLSIFGWLAIACYTTGHYREMATWSARQLRLARQIFREPTPTSASTALVEALLNVARSELGQGNLSRANFFAAEALIAAGESSEFGMVSMARSKASSNEILNSTNSTDQVVTDNRRLSGYCHLVAAHASFGEGQISSGLEHLDRSLLVARQSSDQLLELFVQMALAQLFLLLKDFNRALHYCGRCETMARSLQPAQSPDITACRRSISLYYATIMRKLGRPDYAETIVQELLGDSACTRDPSFQANCFVLLGDLARSEGQFLRAYSLYENAYSLMRQSGSRFGELTVLLQLAKCLLRMRENGTVCECKTVEVLQRCCLFARSSNANLIRVKSLRFLAKVLFSLGDTKAANVTTEELTRLRTSIGLLCAICRSPVGEKQSAVSILPCAHLAHDDCLLLPQHQTGSASCSSTLNRNRSLDQKYNSQQNLPSASNDETSKAALRCRQCAADSSPPETHPAGISYQDPLGSRANLSSNVQMACEEEQPYMNFVLANHQHHREDTGNQPQQQQQQSVPPFTTTTNAYSNSMRGVLV